MPNSTTQPKAKYPLIGVRLTPTQFLHLDGQAKATGKTIQDVIRDAVFAWQRPQPLLDEQRARTLNVELSRIGNNVNQIARALNTGMREGFHADFEGFQEDFRRFQRLIWDNHGVR